MTRRKGFQFAVAASVAVVIFVAWEVVRPATVFAQAARAIREAKGFTCDLIDLATDGDGRPIQRGKAKMYLASTGERRFDHFRDATIESTSISLPGKPGLNILHRAKSYLVEPPDNAQYGLALHLIAGLARYKGNADAELGLREVAGVKASGFSVSWSKLTGDAGPGQVKVWLDPTTNLPVRVEISDMIPNQKLTEVFENFVWGAPDASVFNVTPPEDYKKLTSAAPSLDKSTEHAIRALSAFAKYNNGQYPKVRVLYGDQHGEELRRLMKLDASAPGWIVPDERLKWDDPKHGEFAYATYGLTVINGLERKDVDCVYHGKTVTVRDADRVLLRWKLDDGRYRVIFGDLKTDTVSPERLKQLETN